MKRLNIFNLIYMKYPKSKFINTKSIQWPPRAEIRAPLQSGKQSLRDGEMCLRLACVTAAQLYRFTSRHWMVCSHVQRVMGRIKTPQKDAYFPTPKPRWHLPDMARRITRLRPQRRRGMVLN